MPKRSKTKSTFIFKVGDTYYFRESFNGMRVECSLKTTDWEIAKIKAQELRVKYDPSLLKTAKRTIKEVWPAYDLYNLERHTKTKKIRASTLKEYRDLFQNHLIPFFEHHQLREIDEKSWEKYRDEQKGLALENHRKVFGHFLKWCSRQQYIGRVPELQLEARETREGVAFYDNEIKAILKHSNPNLTLYILMYLTMAMRRMEIMTLSWANVDFKSRAVFLPKEITKTKKDRVVPISETVLKLLTQKREADPKGLFVFPHRDSPKKHMDPGAFKGSWGRAKAKATSDLVEAATTKEERAQIETRMNKATPHDFRRTWKSRAHMRTDVTDTQKEKFAGSSIDVQKEEYVIMEADQLRPLANVVQVQGLKSMLNQRPISWGKSGVKRGKSK